MTTTTAASAPPFSHALLAGSLAGTAVDLSLFPLDTLKTRLQSGPGFLASGGFRGVYRGVGSAIVGSAPGAALFFCSYEYTKAALSRRNNAGNSGSNMAFTHMAAASVGEVAACAVRVPTEVIKQRAQAGVAGSSTEALWSIMRQMRTIGAAGVWRELYRGWTITVMREVPFTVIQFPLWEAMKAWSVHRRIGLASTEGRRAPDGQAGALESAFYGSAAGAVAAGATTPLDVLKTRLMLAKERTSMWSMLRSVLRQSGPGAFFSGFAPRMLWISVGGAIFLGSYQWAINEMSRWEDQR